MKLITVFQAFNPMEAQVIRSRLEVAEFHPFVNHELAALSMEGYSVANGGILVQVPEDEAQEAREFLDAKYDPPESSETAVPES